MDGRYATYNVKPMRTIKANSAMRTKPASTIGEIGLGAGRPATSNASGVSVRALDAVRARAIMRSATAAAPATLIVERMSELLMRAPKAPAVLDQVHGGSAP